ncbi:MAG: cytochrome c [Pseudomonadota bacterium]
MRYILRPFTVFAALCLACPPVSAADPELGRQIAKKCSVCHGKLGIAQDPEMPNLAGQSAFYIEKSLKDFQSGAREDRRMTLMAEPLSDDDIRNVAAWYASLVVTVTPPPDQQ